jgi:hypothetical protein
MNIAIRITQVLLALFALNGIYGLALQLSLAPLSSGQEPTAWDVLGSIVAALTIGLIIFLLQRYYEIRNKSFSTISTKKFLSMTLTGASIAIFIGLSIVVLIFVFALLNL